MAIKLKGKDTSKSKKNKRISSFTWVKISVLLCLLLFCAMKYVGCFSILQPKSKAELIEKEKFRNSLIVEQTHSFLAALQAEDLDKATEFATLRGLETVMKIPIDHLEYYEILNIDSDKHSAEVETLVNGSVRTIVYLKKEGNTWLVNSVIPDKKSRFNPL